MKYLHIIPNKCLAGILLSILVCNTVAIPGCLNESTGSIEPLNEVDLSIKSVPDIDIDLYACVVKNVSIRVPGELLGIDKDILVESLDLWGIPADGVLVFGGRLIFADAEEAKELIDLISIDNIWTKLNDRTIHFVMGSGAVAEEAITAISNNRFTSYDNPQAISEATLLPDTESARLQAIGVALPGETLMNLLSNSIPSEYYSMIQNIITDAKIQTVVAGLYASQDIDISEIYSGITGGNLWDMNLAITVLLKSELTGIVVNPIIQEQLKNAGFVASEYGDVTVYKGGFDIGNGNNLPVYIRLIGNRIYVAASREEGYITNVLTETGLTYSTTTSKTTDNFTAYDIAAAVAEDGTFVEDIDIESDDNKVKITIKKGTTGKTREDKPVTEMIITELKTPPAEVENVKVVGSTYDIEAGSPTFSEPITLTFTYRAEDVPEGTDENKLFIARWQDEHSRWEDLPTTVDTSTKTVFTSVTHLSKYAVLSQTSSSQGNEEAGDEPVSVSGKEESGTVSEEITESSGENIIIQEKEETISYKSTENEVASDGIAWWVWLIIGFAAICTIYLGIMIVFNRIK